jgi:hypothetical protein
MHPYEGSRELVGPIDQTLEPVINILRHACGGLSVLFTVNKSKQPPAHHSPLGIRGSATRNGFSERAGGATCSLVG